MRTFILLAVAIVAGVAVGNVSATHIAMGLGDSPGTVGAFIACVGFLCGAAAFFNRKFTAEL